MKGKIALALAGLLVLTVMLTWPLYTKPAAANPDRSWLYYDMLLFSNQSAELAGGLTIGGGFGTPLVPARNITFSNPWYYNATYGWIVNLTVPFQTHYLSSDYMYNSMVGWLETTTNMTVDGHGWIFLNASKGDVDCYTSNNNTGSYWISPSPMAGQLAAPPNLFPFRGADGVPGTADDGFGNGTADPAGSSILYIKYKITARYASAGTGWQFKPFFSYDWIGVYTTAVAYDIVTESTSLLNGIRAKAVGQPWEFMAGLDHPGQGPVPHGHPKWNAYVTYAQAWSQHNLYTFLGDLDILVGQTTKLVREDCVIADIDCTEEVDITDIVICALAFGAKNVNFGTNGKPDGPPPGGDDKITSDPNWNPQADTNVPRREIDIGDIVRIAIDFGAKLTPDCIIRL